MLDAKAKSASSNEHTGKPLQIWQIVCVVVLSATITTAAHVLVFRSATVASIQQQTYGIINSTLIANWILILLVIVITLRISFQFRFSQMGLTFAGLKRAALVLTAWVLIAQVFSASVALARSGRLELITDLESIAAFLGTAIGQIFGNAFYEEVVFRGVLFRQLQLFWQAKQYSSAKSTICAGLMSSALFSLQHLPNRLFFQAYSGALWLELLLLMVAGLFFVAMYIRTGNLWVVIGIHAMANSLFYLWETPVWVQPLTMAVVAGYLIARRSPFQQ